MQSGIIFGAGNIGRGFIGQLFHQSGYSITMVDIDQLLLDAINAQGSYTIRLVDNDGEQSVNIKPVTAIHSNDRASVIEAFCNASLGATAVGARVLPHIAPLVAEGMAERRRRSMQQPVNLILCENLKGAAQKFRDMVAGHLSAGDQAYALEYLGLVDTVIGRMVPPPTDEMRRQDPGLIIVEPYQELPVDRRGFIGNIPEITNMEPCDNFPAYTARKLYIHNCGHATLAYLGYLKNYEYGWQALADDGVRAHTRQAMQESKQGIAIKHSVEPEWLESHIEDLLHRFTNRALGDTIFRLGRDPIRKLSPSDRLVGAARLVEEAGIEPEAISRAIAAGYCFDPVEDPIAMELQEKIKTQGFLHTLAEISEIFERETLSSSIHSYYSGFSRKTSKEKR